MKNHRDVCYAKDAGFIEFDCLTGSIKTGCLATPDYKSRFRIDYKKQTAELRSYNDQDLDKNESSRMDIPCHCKVSDSSLQLRRLLE